MYYVGFAACCLLGLVFATSAISKVRSRRAFDEFAAATRRLLLAVIGPRYRPGYSSTRRISILVIAAESAVPVLLVVPASRPLGLGLAGLLLIAFGVGIGVALRRGIRTSCRCFGSSARPLGSRHLTRNAFLLLAAAGSWAVAPSGEADLGGRLVAACGAALLTVLVVRLDDLMDLFTS